MRYSHHAWSRSSVHSSKKKTESMSKDCVKSVIKIQRLSFFLVFRWAQVAAAVNREAPVRTHTHAVSDQ